MEKSIFQKNSTKPFSVGNTIPICFQMDSLHVFSPCTFLQCAISTFTTSPPLPTSTTSLSSADTTEINVTYSEVDR